MQQKRFAQVLDNQFQRCQDVLISKSVEYSSDVDRLHNFKVAAKMQGVTVRQALAGMMAKHTTSVYDMCVSEDQFDLRIWDEKITDHLNYLLLLRAVVEEERRDFALAGHPANPPTVIRPL